MCVCVCMYVCRHDDENAYEGVECVCMYACIHDVQPSMNVCRCVCVCVYVDTISRMV
jgi:hypothetical protein